MQKSLSFDSLFGAPLYASKALGPLGVVLTPTYVGYATDQIARIEKQFKRFEQLIRFLLFNPMIADVKQTQFSFLVVFDCVEIIRTSNTA